MDVLYILGKESLARDEEIKYSLRSLEENLLDMGKVFVVGQCPQFLKNVTHIPAQDDTDCRWKNVHIKTLLACESPALSDDFLLMNDDFFLLEPVAVDEFPFYSLKGANGGPCGKDSFQVHCPIRFNKEMYKKMPFSIDDKACKSPRTMYANFYGAPPLPTCDYILNNDIDSPRYEEQVMKWPFFSISNSTMLHVRFTRWLASRYPIPSSYEK